MMWYIASIIIVFIFIWFFYNSPLALVDMIPFIKITKSFTDDLTGKETIDYSKKENWYVNTAHKGIDQKADVFFVHRTTFLSRQAWNSEISKSSLDKTTYTYAVKIQTRIFEGIANIYAPKYRQATLYSFYDKSENNNGQKALDKAYKDVKNSFLYYLKTYHNERPIILAGHSQGTFHLQRLLLELFDENPALRKKLICAYLVAMPIGKHLYQHIFPSRIKDDINCYVSWSTFGKNAYPLYFKGQYDDALCTNPISWEHNSTVQTSKNKHKGAYTYYFNIHVKNKVQVYVHKGVLQISRLGLGFFKLRKRDYVPMDYHIFYDNIRENVQQRITTYYKKNHESKEILYRDRSYVS